MMSRGVEGVPAKDADNVNEGLPPAHAIAWTRRPRGDGIGTNVTMQTKRSTEGTGPSQTGKKTKTKNIADFGCPGHVSDNINEELSSERDDTSHAEALSDSI